MSATIVGADQLRLLLLAKSNGPAMCERCDRPVEKATATDNPLALFMFRFECHGAAQDVTRHELLTMRLRAPANVRRQAPSDTPINGAG